MEIIQTSETVTSERRTYLAPEPSSISAVVQDGLALFTIDGMEVRVGVDTLVPMLALISAMLSPTSDE